MSDSEQRHYPRQNGRVRRHNEEQDDPTEEQGYADDRPPLPANGLLNSLIIGAVAGLLCVALNIGLTYANSPIYNAVASEGSQLTTNTYIIFGLACLNFFVTLLSGFLAGFVAGRVGVQRRLGFFAGSLAGLITYIASTLVVYLPNYPGKIATQSPVTGGAIAGGIVVIFVFVCIWGFIGGLMGLWGARTATRRHPYYVGYPLEEDDVEEDEQ